MNQEFKASLKSADTEEHIDIYFYRPIGYQWARFFRMLHVTPNVVTILSIFLGVGAGICFYFDDLAINILGIFLLIFSRTAVVGAKAIRNLSLIALLLFFEFINLLLHPFLDRVTNHSPLLMLLCMAAIAGLLIPLHHRMEHWITNMLVSKNNRVRLEAARRTIEELEARPNETNAS